MTNPVVKPTTETTAMMLDFPPPTWLKHQALFMMPYAPFDGRYAPDSDAKYLSLGLAQWRNEKDPDALSAKVWRYVAGKWSRMSEEIPLHRLVDLSILVVKMFYQNHPTNAFAPTAVIEAGTFAKQTEKMELRLMNERPKGFEKENEELKERFRKLRDELNAASLD